MNAEQKKMYFTETALALNREGFHAEKILGGTLGVWLDDEPLCEVSEVGGITYRGENISTPEREAAKDKAYRIVSSTAQYMKQMEQAPPLKATGLEDQYKLLAEFNGTVLAGMYSKHGVQFVTWERDHDGSGLHWGHSGAWLDLAVSCTKIPVKYEADLLKQQQKQNEEMAECPEQQTPSAMSMAQQMM